MPVTADEIQERLAGDFEFFAEHCLKISTKSKGLQPFYLNPAQKLILDEIERQMDERGYVRLILPKARQLGCSTFVGGYAYWRTITNSHYNTFILSHASDTTESLFNMTKRFHDNCPEEIRPDTDSISYKRIHFTGIDSSYAIGTAGSRDVGRGRTIQFLHASESAFWANYDEHWDGVGEAIPSGDDAQGTVVIVESTANGQTGGFYDMCQRANKGDGEYKILFLPWFLEEAYRTEPPVDWEIPDEFAEIQAKHNLDEAQIYWYYVKGLQKGSMWRLLQEFPSTLDEAFQTSGEESFIGPELIAEIRTPKYDMIASDLTMPRIGACDPAWTGDRASIGYRIGSRVCEVKYYQGKDPTELSQICADYLKANELDRLFVDTIGIGAGVYSNLKAWGYGNVVRQCNFARAAVDLNPDGQPMYLNKRAECWGRMKAHMEDSVYEIPNTDELCADLMAPQYHYNNARGVLQLESKKEMKARGVSSPDGGDVIAMTYAEPVTQRLIAIPGRDTIEVITEYNALEF